MKPSENWESALELGGKIIDFEGELRPDGLNKLKTLLARSLEEQRGRLAEKINALKCDERKVGHFAEQRAETFDEKNLANAVLSEVLQIIQNMK